MRERYAPATIEEYPQQNQRFRQPAWKSEPEPVVEAKPHREVISTEKNRYRAESNRWRRWLRNETAYTTANSCQVSSGGSIVPEAFAQRADLCQESRLPSGVQERAYDISKEARTASSSKASISIRTT